MVVRPTMLYSLETMALRKRQEADFEVPEVKMLSFFLFLLSLLRVIRIDKTRNEYIRGTADVRCFGEKIREAEKDGWKMYRGGIVNILAEVC